MIGGKVLQRLTPATIVERSRLEKECAAIRRQRYALSRGELFSGVTGMAAPVFDHNNDVCGALTISGPVQRFTEKRRPEMLDSLLAAARNLSQLMGSSG
jgi:DNA-binding IclR family transcriptional regulator